jgi:hypothetical protein
MQVAILASAHLHRFQADGPLATSWHANTFLNPARDGAVLPVLNLNDDKIANPCFLARIPRDELQKLIDDKPYIARFRDDMLGVRKRSWRSDAGAPERAKLPQKRSSRRVDGSVGADHAVESRAPTRCTTQRLRTS